MSVDERSEREMLQRARRGLAPAAADALRIRRSVAIALAAAVPPAAAPEAGVSPDDLTAPEAAHGASWALKLSVVGAFAVSAGLGYVAGHRAGVEQGRSHPPSPPAAMASASAAVPAEVRALAPLVSAPALETPAAARSSAPRAPREAPSASGASRAAFDEEVIQVRRVQKALREGNARLALALLGDLDRSVPAGRLGEERAAADAIARCTLGVGPPVVLAADFAAKYPSSVHSARVAQACSADSDE